MKYTRPPEMTKGMRTKGGIGASASNRCGSSAEQRKQRRLYRTIAEGHRRYLKAFPVGHWVDRYNSIAAGWLALARNG